MSRPLLAWRRRPRGRWAALSMCRSRSRWWPRSTMASQAELLFGAGDLPGGWSSTSSVRPDLRSFEAGAVATRSAPTRKAAISSTGLMVAERPMRAGRASQTWSRRARVSARWLPRLSRARAWISSTMTVRTCAQGLAAALGGEHEVERLGRRDQDVRRRLDERPGARPGGCRRCGAAVRMPARA